MESNHLRNHIEKRKRELHEAFSSLNEDMDKLENLARQDELLELLEWLRKSE